MAILLFARDPGAADIVSKIYDLISEDKILVAKDFAKQIFDKNKIPFLDFNSEVLDRSVRDKDYQSIKLWLQSISPELVITGTTHFDDMTDRLIWETANELQIPSISVFDQWLRVEERFQVNSKLYRPDYVLTGNKSIAEKLLSKNLCRQSATAIGSPFLQSVSVEASNFLVRKVEARERIKEFFNKSFEHLIVYVSEPQRKLTKAGAQFEDVAYDEIEVFEFVSEGLAKSNLKSTLLVVKLHPKEDRDEYAGRNVNLLQNEIEKNLILAAADILVGTKSMLLMEAVLYQKHVLSIDLWNLPDEQLITNQLGLTTKITNHHELVSEFNGHQFFSPMKIGEVNEKLSLNTDWKSLTLEVIKDAKNLYRV
ncbi:MAG: hypothetical protein R3A13_01260 [Bdellovibrionota bacterium]